MVIEVPADGRVCLPREVLTVAHSVKRGLLLEVVSGNGKPYPLLLKSNGDSLYAIHKCYATAKGIPCKHLRTAILLTERWLDIELPRVVHVDLRWLKREEAIAKEDLTPLFYDRQGEFKSVRLA